MTVTLVSPGRIHNWPAHLLLHVFLFVDVYRGVGRVSQGRWPTSLLVLPVFYYQLLLTSNVCVIWVGTASVKTQRTKSRESVFKENACFRVYNLGMLCPPHLRM